MSFKNFTPLKLRADCPLTVDFLAERLARQRFMPCPNSMLAVSGFVPPVDAPGVGPENQRYVLEVPGVGGERFAMIVLRLESRLLPASVIKKAFQERLEELELAMGGKKLTGRAKKDVKEEVIRSLIPKAFTRLTDIRALFALKSGWLFVESSSPNKTDAFVTRLVGALDMAPFRLPKPKMPASLAMHGWLLSGEAPEGFSVDRECELKGENAATIRYAHLDLDNEEVRRHVREGKAPQQLAMTYDDRLSFVLTQKMTFKKVGINMTVAARAAHDGMTPIDAQKAERAGVTGENIDADEAALSLCADVLLMGSAFVDGVDALIETLGGEDPDADKAASDAEAAVNDADRPGGESSSAASGDEPDPLYEPAVALVREEGRASISFIQRHFRMGYNRAAGLVERMEKEGVVTPMKTDGTRQVIG